MIGVIPETVQEAIQNWDRGEPVFTVELGGMGPGYEQVIQIAVFETMRRVQQHIPTENSNEAWKQFYTDTVEPTLHDVNRLFDLQMSGAQAGAAESAVMLYLRQGYRNGVMMVGEERRILVSKSWPKATLS